jgi:hypothetical protein
VNAKVRKVYSQEKQRADRLRAREPYSRITCVRSLAKLRGCAFQADIRSQREHEEPRRRITRSRNTLAMSGSPESLNNFQAYRSLEGHHCLCPAHPQSEKGRRRSSRSLSRLAIAGAAHIATRSRVKQELNFSLRLPAKPAEPANRGNRGPQIYYLISCPEYHRMVGEVCVSVA